MKLISFEYKGKASFGAVKSTEKNEGIVDLGTQFSSMRAALEAEALDHLRDMVEARDADIGLDNIRYLPPIPTPEKIFCIGVNYANRNEEYRDDSNRPKYPSIFMRGPGSLVGHNETILRPRESDQLDYEGEIALIIGKPGRRISEANALDHIAGVTCCNEGTLRDWVRHGKFNVTPGKNFDKSGAIGPWMVTRDEFTGLDTMSLSTHVNGEQRQSDTTLNMMFPFSYLIHYISTFSNLVPGDVIVTGTPTGAGARFDPPRYLKPGDSVEVSVEGVGTLRNTIADEA